MWYFVAKCAGAASRILFLSFLFQLSSAAAASEADALGALTDGLRTAWSKHPSASAAQQAIGAARARAEAAARPLYNPELGLAYDDEGTERSSTLSAALTLDLSGKRGARTAAGAAELLLAQAQGGLARSRFALDWLRAWSMRAAAAERVSVGTERLTLMRGFATQAELRSRRGDISALELDLALLARDEAEASQATLLAEEAAAVAQFLGLGGHPGVSSLPFEDGLAWQRSGIARFPPQPSWEARVATRAAVGAEQRIAIADRARRPDPTLSVRAGEIDRGPFTDSVVGLQISYPLYIRNGFGAQLEAAHAEANQAVAEQRRVELEMSARGDGLTRAHDAVLAAWLRWSASRGTDAARRAELLERLWRAGEMSTADYLLQLKQSLDTRLAGINLLERLWLSGFDALYASGRLDAWVGFPTPEPEVTR